MRMNYAPDMLNPIAYMGDSLTRGIANLPTVTNTHDVQVGAGGDAIRGGLQDLTNAFASVATGANASPDPSNPSPTDATVTNAAASNPFGTWNPFAIFSAVGNGIDRVLIGLTALIVLAIGLYAFFKS